MLLSFIPPKKKTWCLVVVLLKIPARSSFRQISLPVAAKKCAKFPVGSHRCEEPNSKIFPSNSKNSLQTNFSKNSENLTRANPRHPITLQLGLGHSIDSPRRPVLTFNGRLTGKPMPGIPWHVTIYVLPWMAGPWDPQPGRLQPGPL